MNRRLALGRLMATKRVIHQHGEPIVGRYG